MKIKQQTQLNLLLNYFFFHSARQYLKANPLSLCRNLCTKIGLNPFEVNVVIEIVKIHQFQQHVTKFFIRKVLICNSSLIEYIFSFNQSVLYSLHQDRTYSHFYKNQFGSFGSKNWGS